MAYGSPTRMPAPDYPAIVEAFKADAFHAHNGMMAALAERDALLWLVDWLQRALEGAERRLVAR